MALAREGATISSRLMCTVIGVSLLAACADDAWPPPPPVVLDDYAAAFSEWRQERRDRLVTPPGGSVLWVGLWELEPGPNGFGTDPELPIVLPAEDAPSFVGVLTRDDRSVRLDPAPGAGFRDAEGEPISGPIDLAHDRTAEPTQFWLGSLGMRIHAERGTDRLWLRVWDEALPARETFQLPESFPLDAGWRIAARFEPYPEPKALAVRDVTSGMLEYTVPGELVFEREGVTHRLLATASETSTSFFVMMWDETARTATYQAGRYLRVPFPEEDGWTVIDFNRAYNAPCAFTAHSVCGLPPPENHLPFEVAAGEKRPAS